jgi:hypothetical protein
MLDVEVTMDEREQYPDQPREADGRLKRPCLEEFMSAGYAPELYENYFGEAWGPAWSNPNWVRSGAPPKPRGPDALDEVVQGLGLPDVLVVHSQVRKVATRTVRTQHPTRHRFKQYLLGDPHKRLTRRRPVVVTARDLVQNVDSFIEHEAVGRLSVHTKDGRRLDLVQLKAGIPVIAAAPPIPAQYNRRLDSLEYDIPAGNPLPIYVDGTFPGDPAAQRALERITAEKQAEAIRQGATEETPTPEESEESEVIEESPVVEEKIEASNSEVESVEAAPEPADPLAVTEEPPPPPPSAPAASNDPALSRSTTHSKKRRR